MLSILTTEKAHFVLEIFTFLYFSLSLLFLLFAITEFVGEAYWTKS